MMPQSHLNDSRRVTDDYLSNYYDQKWKSSQKTDEKNAQRSSPIFERYMKPKGTYRRSRSSPTCKGESGHRQVKFAHDSSPLRDDKSFSFYKSLSPKSKSDYKDFVLDDCTKYSSKNEKYDKIFTNGSVEHKCNYCLVDSDPKGKPVCSNYVSTGDGKKYSHRSHIYDDVSSNRLLRYWQLRERMGIIDYCEEKAGDKVDRYSSDYPFTYPFSSERKQKYHVCPLPAADKPPITKDNSNILRRVCPEYEKNCQLLSDKLIDREPKKSERKDNEVFSKFRFPSSDTSKFSKEVHTHSDKYRCGKSADSRMASGRDHNIDTGDYSKEFMSPDHTSTRFKNTAKYHYCDLPSFDKKSSIERAEKSLGTNDRVPIYDRHEEIPHERNVKTFSYCPKPKSYLRKLPENSHLYDGDMKSAYLDRKNKTEDVEEHDCKRDRPFSGSNISNKYRDTYRSSLTSTYDDPRKKLDRSRNERMAAGGDNNLNENSSSQTTTSVSVSGNNSGENEDAQLEEMRVHGENRNNMDEYCTVSRDELMKQLTLLKRIQELLFQVLRVMRNDARRIIHDEQTLLDECQTGRIRRSLQDSNDAFANLACDRNILSLNDQCFQPIDFLEDDHEFFENDDRYRYPRNTATYSLKEEIEAPEDENLHREFSSLDKTVICNRIHQVKFNSDDVGYRDPGSRSSEVSNNENVMNLNDEIEYDARTFQEQALRKFVKDCTSFSQQFALYSKYCRSQDSIYIAEYLDRCAELINKVLDNIPNNSEFWNLSQFSPLRSSTFVLPKNRSGSTTEVNPSHSHSSPEMKEFSFNKSVHRFIRPSSRKQGILKCDSARKSSNRWKVANLMKHHGINSNKSTQSIKRPIPRYQSSFRAGQDNDNDSENRQGTKNNNQFSKRKETENKFKQIIHNCKMKNAKVTESNSKENNKNVKVSPKFKTYVCAKSGIKINRKRRPKLWHKCNKTSNVQKTIIPQVTSDPYSFLPSSSS